MQHLYRVKAPYTSVGANGVKEFKVGNEVILDRPSNSSRLELIATGEPEPVRDLAAALAAKQDADKALADLRDQNEKGGRALQEALDANAKLSADLAAAKDDADAQKAQVAELRGKLEDAEKALAAQKPAAGKKA